MSRKGKLPPIKPDVDMVLRVVQRQASGVAIIATETPIERWDEKRQMVVHEVLLMDGCRFRGGRDHIPIVDSHDDTTVRNVLGSIQRMQITDGQLFGTPSWASTQDAQNVATLVNEGHITDFSITALPTKSVFVNRGQQYTTPRGQVIDGPAIIHEEWEPHNASICTTGADVNSVVRRSYTDLKRKVKRMDDALLGQLKELGLPDGMADPDQILAWVIGKMKPAESSTEPMVQSMEGDEMKDEMKPAEVVEEKPVEQAAATSPVARSESATDLIKRALADDQKRRNEIQAAVKIAKLEQTFADELCNSGVTVSEANARIIQRMATQPIGSSIGGDIRTTQSADDKFYAAVRDGLIARSFRVSGSRQNAFSGVQPAPGYEDFQHAKLSRIAEEFCERMGCNVRRMAPKDIALVAMGHPGAANRYRIQRDAYHTTGSFPNLLLDASNKTLLTGYEEAPYTWEIWARNAGTTDDFKTINRIRFSEMATPEMVPENDEYKESKMSDSKESYVIHKYGSVFTITWETVVNDDLDAISRIPAMQGAACRRKQNQAVYAVLTDNAAMADTGLLFNATAQTTAGGHNNLDTGAGAPSVTTLNAAYIKMMTKKGLRADVILNLQPSYLIVPAALSATVLQLVGSIADPSAGGSAAGNSNTKNIYGPNGDRPLRVVVEPLLDANSSTAWYLAASNNQVDTVEVTFLSGEQSPVLESEWDFDKDVYKYKVRQTFGTAAIDFRGLYKHAGA